jgi:hypothetical protein
MLVIEMELLHEDAFIQTSGKREHLVHYTLQS